MDNEILNSPNKRLLVLQRQFIQEPFERIKLQNCSEKILNLATLKEKFLSGFPYQYTVNIQVW